MSYLGWTATFIAFAVLYAALGWTSGWEARSTSELRSEHEQLALEVEWLEGVNCGIRYTVARLTDARTPDLEQEALLREWCESVGEVTP